VGLGLAKLASTSDGLGSRLSVWRKRPGLLGKPPLEADRRSDPFVAIFSISRESAFEKWANKQICMATPSSNLRKLRKVLRKTQTEMAVLAGCSRHAIAMIEEGHMTLSVGIAAKISETTRIGVTWLMNNDSVAEMINSAGVRYSGEDQQ
jgi:DNA-binding XRE family transcriptional regulator